MKKKYVINFREADSPIIEPITKFGGQPVWIAAPEWPVSRSTGKQLMFICQIVLEEKIFGKIESKMAYIFINDDEDADTFDPDCGENAVIIQPNGNNPSSVPVMTGETLSVWKEVEGQTRRQPFACEFAVERAEIVDDEEKSFNESLTEAQEREPKSDNEADNFTKYPTANNLSGEDLKPKISLQVTHYTFDSLAADEDDDEPGFENKVGGNPNFLQNEEFPDADKPNWNLLLQLDSSNIPFDLEFGDVGVGYAFISKDGKRGKFLWQCS